MGTELLLVDIRSHEELLRAAPIGDSDTLHLPYSEWVEWGPRVLAGELPLQPELETVFYCHRGGRGERIAQYLLQNGLVQARFLRGGINGYAEEADASVPVYLES